MMAGILVAKTINSTSTGVPHPNPFSRNSPSTSVTHNSDEHYQKGSISWGKNHRSCPNMGSNRADAASPYRLLGILARLS